MNQETGRNVVLLTVGAFLCARHVVVANTETADHTLLHHRVSIQSVNLNGYTDGARKETRERPKRASIWERLIPNQYRTTSRKNCKQSSSTPSNNNDCTYDIIEGRFF